MSSVAPALRVLLVDDGAHHLALIRDELTRLGYVVVGVIDFGGPAVRRARHRPSSTS